VYPGVALQRAADPVNGGRQVRDVDRDVMYALASLAQECGVDTQVVERLDQLPLEAFVDTGQPDSDRKPDPLALDDAFDVLVPEQISRTDAVVVVVAPDCCVEIPDNHAHLLDVSEYRPSGHVTTYRGSWPEATRRTLSAAACPRRLEVG
jgi:hypothetical protein